MFWKHKALEVKRKWEHELQIVKIYASILRQNNSQSLDKMYGNQGFYSPSPTV